MRKSISHEAGVNLGLFGINDHRLSSLRDFLGLKWWNRQLTLKCKLKSYVKPMKDPLGVSPSKGNQGTTRGKEKILLNSVRIEPTTSGLDLPLLCRLSYEVGQRMSGTILVGNRGEEKVRVHMNVVPRSTMNTNGGTEN